MIGLGSSKLWWLLLAVACQFVWGVYPAVIRYLQTRAERPLTSLQLSFLINLLACPALLLGTTLPLLVANAWRRRGLGWRQLTAQSEHGPGLPRSNKGKGKPAAAGGHQPWAPRWDSALAEPLLPPADEEEASSASPLAPAPAGLQPALPSSAAETPLRERQHLWGDSRRRAALVLSGTTFFLTALFLAQVFALLFTSAPISQMVFLLAPVMVALMAKGLYRTPLPPGLWPALFGMLLGCAMVVGSKAAAGTPPCRGAAAARLWPAQSKEAWLCTAVFGERHGAWLCGSSDAMPSNTTHGTNTAIDGSTGHVHDGGLGLRDALGIGLSFLGASSLAAFMLLVQRSHGVVSEQQVLWACFLFQAALSLLLTWRLERRQLSVLLHLGAGELGAVALLATGVNWGANLVQQLCIRALGAPQAAAFLPVRLLGSLVASYPLSGEGLDGPVQWGGTALLLAAVTGYLLQQKRVTEQTVAEAALAAAMREADQGTEVDA